MAGHRRDLRLVRQPPDVPQGVTPWAPDREPWRQQPGEADWEYALFRQFLRQPQRPRVLSAVITDIAPAQLQRISRKRYWKRRSEHHDEQLLEQAKAYAKREVEASLGQFLERIDTQLRTVDLLQSRVQHLLENMNDTAPLDQLQLLLPEGRAYMTAQEKLIRTLHGLPKDYSDGTPLIQQNIGTVEHHDNRTVEVKQARIVLPEKEPLEALGPPVDAEYREVEEES